MDLQGDLIKEESTEGSTAKIDFEGLSEGIYFIQIIQNGKTYREKIIKN